MLLLAQLVFNALALQNALLVQPVLQEHAQAVSADIILVLGTVLNAHMKTVLPVIQHHA